MVVPSLFPARQQGNDALTNKVEAPSLLRRIEHMVTASRVYVVFYFGTEVLEGGGGGPGTEAKENERLQQQRSGLHGTVSRDGTRSYYTTTGRLPVRSTATAERLAR